MPTQTSLPKSSTGTFVRRLLILIPDQEVDQIRLSRAIWAIPCQGFVEVLFVTIVSDADQELAARRRLATLSMYVRDAQYTVDFKVCWEHSWGRALAGLLEPGDLLVYPPELSAPAGLAKRQPLAQVLQPLGAALYPLGGFFQEPERNWPRRSLMRLGYWIVIFLILIGFFNLESTASLSIPGGIGHLVTILVMLVEFGALYLWTAIAG